MANDLNKYVQIRSRVGGVVQSEPREFENITYVYGLSAVWDATKRTISGKLTCNQPQPSVSGVTITLKYTESSGKANVTHTVKTGSDGSYVDNSPPIGYEYSVQATTNMQGPYQDKPETVTSQTVKYKVVYTYTLKLTYSATGNTMTAQLTASEGGGLKGQPVVITYTKSSGEKTTHSFTADDSGKVTDSNIPKGGKFTAVATCALTPPYGGTVNLTSNTATYTIEYQYGLTLTYGESARTMTAQLTASEGGGLSGQPVVITYTDSSGAKTVHTLSADSSGKVTDSNIPKGGKFTAVATCALTPPYGGTVNLTSNTITYTVEYKYTLTLTYVNTPGDRKVTGKLVASEGDDVSGLEVIATTTKPDNSGITNTRTTNSSGEVTFPVVTGGPNTISAQCTLRSPTGERVVVKSNSVQYTIKVEYTLKFTFDKAANKITTKVLKDGVEYTESYIRLKNVDLTFVNNASSEKWTETTYTDLQSKVGDITPKIGGTFTLTGSLPFKDEDNNSVTATGELQYTFNYDLMIVASYNTDTARVTFNVKDRSGASITRGTNITGKGSYSLLNKGDGSKVEDTNASINYGYLTIFPSLPVIGTYTVSGQFVVNIPKGTYTSALNNQTLTVTPITFDIPESSVTAVMNLITASEKPILCIVESEEKSIMSIDFGDGKGARKDFTTATVPSQSYLTVYPPDDVPRGKELTVTFHDTRTVKFNSNLSNLTAPRHQLLELVSLISNSRTYGLSLCEKTDLRKIWDGALTKSKNCSSYSSAFRNCTKLTETPARVFGEYLVPSGSSIGLDTSYAFSGCTALTTVNLLVENGNRWASMFEGCTALTTDVTKMITQSIKADCRNMFKNCSKLTGKGQTVYDLVKPYDSAPDYQKAYTNGMFYNCVSLSDFSTLPDTTKQDA